MGDQEKSDGDGKRAADRSSPESAPEDEVVRLPAGDFRKSKELRSPDLDPLPSNLPGAAPAAAHAEEEAFLHPEEAFLHPEEGWTEADQTRSGVPVGWVVLLAAVLLAALIWALIRIPEGDANLERRAAVVEQRLEEEQDTLEEAERLSEQIGRVMRGYLSAETVEEKAGYVRMPERVLPLMKDHYRTNPLIPLRPAAFYFFEPVAVVNYPFLLGKMELEDGGAKVLLLEDANGQVLVDWESDVAHQPMPVDEFIRKRPLEPMVFRLNVAWDDFYAFEFSDQERFQSLFLSQRDKPEFLFGYVPRDSPTFSRLVELLGRPPQDGGKGREVTAVMVEVRFPAGGDGPRSVRVLEVVAPRWALVTPPADEGK